MMGGSVSQVMHWRGVKEPCFERADWLKENDAACIGIHGTKAAKKKKKKKKRKKRTKRRPHLGSSVRNPQNAPCSNPSA